MIQIIYQIWKLEEAVFMASAIHAIMFVLVIMLLDKYDCSYDIIIEICLFIQKKERLYAIKN